MVGKSSDDVFPATKIAPFGRTAMAVPASPPESEPPRSVEKTSDVPSAESFDTNASWPPSVRSYAPSVVGKSADRVEPVM